MFKVLTSKWVWPGCLGRRSVQHFRLAWAREHPSTGARKRWVQQEGAQGPARGLHYLRGGTDGGGWLARSL